MNNVGIKPARLKFYLACFRPFEHTESGEICNLSELAFKYCATPSLLNNWIEFKSLYFDWQLCQIMGNYIKGSSSLRWLFHFTHTFYPTSWIRCPQTSRPSSRERWKRATSKSVCASSLTHRFKCKTRLSSSTAQNQCLKMPLINTP